MSQIGNTSWEKKTDKTPVMITELRVSWYDHDTWTQFLSLSLCYCAEKCAMQESAVTRDANSLPMTLTQYPECDRRMLWSDDLLRMRWSLFIRRIVATVSRATCGMNKCFQQRRTFRLLLASNFCRFARARCWREETTFSSRTRKLRRDDDDDTTTSSTSNASIRKTVSGQNNDTRPYSKHDCGEGGKDRYRMEREREGKIREWERKMYTRNWRQSDVNCWTSTIPHSYRTISVSPLTETTNRRSPRRLPLPLTPASSIRLAW